MTRRAILMTVVFAPFLEMTAFGSQLVTGKRKKWVGKNSKGERFSYRNYDGDRWSATENGKESLDYETIETDDDFIEIHAQGTELFKVRIYKDKAKFYSSKDRKWYELAEGEWQD